MDSVHFSRKVCATASLPVYLLRFSAFRDVWLIFFLRVSSEEENIFYCNEVQFIDFFSFRVDAFGVLLKKSLPNSRPFRFSPIFLPRSFIHWALSFRSLLYSQLMFTNTASSELRFLLLHVDFQLRWQHWLKDCHVPHEATLAPLSKQIGHVCLGLFLHPFLFCWPFCLAGHRSSLYWCFIISLEVTWCGSSDLVPFWQYEWGSFCSMGLFCVSHPWPLLMECQSAPSHRGDQKVPYFQKSWWSAGSASPHPAGETSWKEQDSDEHQQHWRKNREEIEENGTNSSRFWGNWFWTKNSIPSQTVNQVWRQNK